jgi:hypothetical protein
MAKNLVGIAISTALMCGGILAVAWGISAPEQTAYVRALVASGICGLLIGSAGFQQMWWAEHRFDGVDLRKRARYPEDLGPGPGGRQTDESS